MQLLCRIPLDRMVLIGTDNRPDGVGNAEIHGICALQFAQGFKRVLLARRVRVYESAEVAGSVPVQPANRKKSTP
jgi:hypothetical protein